MPNHTRRYGTVLDHMGPYRTKCDHLWPFVTIWDHNGPYRPIWDHIGFYRTIQDHIWPYGTFICYVSICLWVNFQFIELLTQLKSVHFLSKLKIYPMQAIWSIERKMKEIVSNFFINLISYVLLQCMKIRSFWYLFSVHAEWWYGIWHMTRGLSSGSVKRSVGTAGVKKPTFM